MYSHVMIKNNIKISQLQLIGVFHLCVIQVCVLVEGRYIVEVRLNGYTNPTGKCNSNNDSCFTRNGRQTCCDSDNTNECMGQERCDSYFVYCLRPLGTVDIMGCPNNEMSTVSLSNEDDGSGIDFSLSRVLGLRNPQIFPGLGNAYEVSYLYSFPSYYYLKS